MGKGKKKNTNGKVELKLPAGLPNPLATTIQDVMASNEAAFLEMLEDFGTASPTEIRRKRNNPAHIAWKALEVWWNSATAVYDSWKDGGMSDAWIAKHDTYATELHFSLCAQASRIVVAWCDDVFKAIDPSPLLHFEWAFNAKWDSIHRKQDAFADLNATPAFLISLERLELVFHEAWLAHDRINGATERQVARDFGGRRVEDIGGADKRLGRRPLNKDVDALCQRLANASRRLSNGLTSENEIAFQFAGESAKSLEEQGRKARGLIRQARRFPHLWKSR